MLTSQDTVVSLRQRTVNSLQSHHLSPMQLLDKRNLTQEETSEIMLPEQRHPRIGSKFIKLHARERTLVQDICTITLMKFEHRIWHGTDNLAGRQLDSGRPDRRQLQLVVHAYLGPEITVLILADALQ